jgi:hypothetical protein
MVFQFLDYLRRWSRLCLWGLRRRYLCPRGRHVWSYFGRSRVCRCCHREEWFATSDGWQRAQRGFAESRPSWHDTVPGDEPDADVIPNQPE